MDLNVGEGVWFLFCGYFKVKLGFWVVVWFVSLKFWEYNDGYFFFVIVVFCEVKFGRVFLWKSKRYVLVVFEIVVVL